MLHPLKKKTKRQKKKKNIVNQSSDMQQSKYGKCKKRESKRKHLLLTCLLHYTLHWFSTKACCLKIILFGQGESKVPAAESPISSPSNLLTLWQKLARSIFKSQEKSWKMPYWSSEVSRMKQQTIRLNFSLCPSNEHCRSYVFQFLRDISYFALGKKLLLTSFQFNKVALEPQKLLRVFPFSLSCLFITFLSVWYYCYDSISSEITRRWTIGATFAVYLDDNFRIVWDEANVVKDLLTGYLHFTAWCPAGLCAYPSSCQSPINL